METNGRAMLENCSQDVKDILINKFGSLDAFYAYVYSMNAELYMKYRTTKQFDESKINKLKDYLESAGIDFMLVNDILSEIGADHDEVIMENYVIQLLGPDWKKRIEQFEQMMGL